MGAKAVPIQRSDLHWLPAEYRDNDDDYPLLQFQLSKGLGRVIGFWDENLIFQIVLLDPLHNLQPSKDYDYTVDPCEPLKCHYSSLIAELDRIGRAMACALDCPTRSRIRDASSGAVPEHMLLIELEADTRAMAIQLIATGKAKGLRDIFEYGVLAMNSE